MLRSFLTLLLFLITQSSFTQLYKTSTGEITFNASTPLENIYAKNTAVNGIININDGKFASVLLITDFKFKRKLMQEHFNENYLESHKYPKATFTGQIENFSTHNITNNEISLAINGILTIHGVSNKIKAPIKIKNQNDTILLKTEFVLKPEDYKIKVPKLVFKKIAQEVLVQAQYTLTKQ